MEGSFFTAGREGRKFRQEDRLRKKEIFLREKKKKIAERTERGNNREAEKLRYENSRKEVMEEPQRGATGWLYSS